MTVKRDELLKQINSLPCMNEKQYKRTIKELKEASVKKTSKTSREYFLMKRYSIISISDVEKLIDKKLTADGSVKYAVYKEEIYDKLYEIHIGTGHGGRNRMVKETANKFSGITREMIMSPLDNEYKFIFVYQDHLTKFVQLRSLKTKTALEVSEKLCEIFMTFGAPHILERIDVTALNIPVGAKAKNLVHRVCLKMKTQHFLLQFVNLTQSTATSLALYKSAFKVLTKKRPNHGRTHLILYCIVALIYGCANDGMYNITVLYTYYKPLSWTPQMCSWWHACMNLCQLIGSLGSAVLLKSLKFSDNSILMISVFSATLKTVGIGIGRDTWVMFTAAILGSVSTVGFPALSSLFVTLGTPDETGELQSVMNLSLAFCYVFSAVVFNNMYTLTLSFYAGFPWLVESALLACCLLILFFTHVDSVRMSRQESVKEKTKIILKEKY